MPRVCVHLQERGPDSEYAQVFSGVGTEYALICPECRKDLAGIETRLTTVTPDRFAAIERAGYLDWDKDAIVGRPEVLVRSTGLRFEHREVSVTGERPRAIADLRPVPSSARGDCLALADDGGVFRIEPAESVVRRVMSAHDAVLALGPKRSLQVAPDGRMAAVVETRGSHGVVLDLEAQRPTMHLDRGNYHPEQTDFPAAFFVLDGRLLLVHATDWNRLDVSDPKTGELLTDRAPTSYQRGEERPAHDLDYFQGSLTVSPAGDWVVDNGWIWHPIGAVVSWSLRRWVAANPWESEDGPTKRALCHRSYFWGGPLCWIDARTVAVWGYGSDEENLIPAAVIFDVESGDRLRWFAGPPGGSFVYDRHLFAYAAEAGMSVWDVSTGERLLHEPSFCPTAYHPGTREFITVAPDGGTVMSRLVGE